MAFARCAIPDATSSAIFNDAVAAGALYPPPDASVVCPENFLVFKHDSSEPFSQNDSNSISGVPDVTTPINATTFGWPTTCAMTSASFRSSSAPSPVASFEVFTATR